MTNMKIHSKKVVVFLLVLLLTYEYLPMLMWAGCRLVTPLEFTISSGVYSFVVRNGLDQPIIVDTYNINDLPFMSDSRRRQIIRARVYNPIKDSRELLPGTQSEIRLPGEDWDIGVLFVVARTKIVRGEDHGFLQRIGSYILGPGDTKWRGKNQLSPLVITVTTDNTKLISSFALKAPSGDNNQMSEGYFPIINMTSEERVFKQ